MRRRFWYEVRFTLTFLYIPPWLWYRSIIGPKTTSLDGTDSLRFEQVRRPWKLSFGGVVGENRGESARLSLRPPREYIKKWRERKLNWSCQCTVKMLPYVADQPNECD